MQIIHLVLYGVLEAGAVANLLYREETDERWLGNFPGSDSRLHLNLRSFRSSVLSCHALLLERQAIT